STFTNAYFETISGLTTTGVSVLTDVEILPRSILFWRSLTQWLGGMGIITMAFALFPAFGISAYQMFRCELPGAAAERMPPHLKQILKILWGVYALLTIVQSLLMWFGGMSLCDSFCHAFGTMASGGFSTRNAGLSSWNSPYLEWVTIIFMFIAGSNFVLHYNLIYRQNFRAYGKDREFKFYVSVLVTAIILILFVLLLFNKPESVQATETSVGLESVRTFTERAGQYHDVVRGVIFQVVSFTSTTGFASKSLSDSPSFIKNLLILLLFLGGCAGSTSGGLKMMRILVLFKFGWREVKTIIQPRLIAPVKVGELALEEKLVAGIVGFVVLFAILFVGMTLVMSLIVQDTGLAITTVAGAICNQGYGLPGLTIDYADLPATGKWVLALCMLIGRLELFAVIIALAPSSWRK
ncbi:MAG: TrkH family potassium uptake protein, partial [Lentisphaerae bacterium]|nr:TrkH family potassium uptake protein [Lentisphaerota bacterium]